MFKGLKGLIAGVVAGTVVGVLFAPKKGKEVRKELKKELDKGGIGVDTLKAVVEEIGKDMEEAGQKVYDDVSKTDGYKKAEKEVRKHAGTAKKAAKEFVKDNIPADTRKKAKKTFVKAKKTAKKIGVKAKKEFNKASKKAAKKTGKNA